MSSKKFAIITGGNSGLGLHLAKALYTKTEFSIIIACRNKEKAENAVEEVINFEKGADNNPTDSSDKQRVRYAILDLVKVDSIKHFVQEISSVCPLGSLSLLVNNAGIMNHPYELTPEGIEIHFATNYLGHFLLTNLLMEYMAPDARILNVTSSYYEKCQGIPSRGILSGKSDPHGFSPNDFYAVSKLANCLHTIALTDRFPHIKAVSIRPGFVRGTNLGRHTNAILRWLATPLIWMVAKNLDQGIATIFHCATCEDLEPGKLYYDKRAMEYKETVHLENANILWKLSEELITAANS